MSKKQIEDLKKLKEQGILTKKEFQEKKKNLEEQELTQNVEEQNSTQEDGFTFESSKNNSDTSLDDDDFIKTDPNNNPNNNEKRKDFMSNPVVKTENETKNKQEEYNNAMRNGYSFELGDVIKKSFEIFKKKPGEFIGFTIASVVIFLIMSTIPIIGNIGTLFVGPVLSAGYLIVTIKAINNQEIVFQDFFLGIKFLMPLAIVGIISSIATGIGFLFLIIPGIYLAVSFSLAPLFVIDHGLDFWPALDNSRKLTNKKFFSIFGLLFVLGLLNVVGLLVCGIGLLVTIPVSSIALAVVYNEIIKVSPINVNF